MRSIRSKFIVFAALVVSVVACGGALNFYFLLQAEKYEASLLATAEAIESHLSATFYNEETRVLAHSALALYGFNADEKKKFEGSIKTYSAGARELAASYGKRSRDEVEKNLARPLLPDAVKNEMKEHLLILTAYHSKTDEYMGSSVQTKEALVEAYANLNAIRGKIGGFRKTISDALAAEKASSSALFETASRNQQNALLGAFTITFAIVLIFLIVLGREVGGFTQAITKGLGEVRAGRAASFELGKKPSTEMVLVAGSFAAP